MGGNIKQDLTKDKRGEIKVDPNIELKDYSGPLRPDLRFTDFSREQLGRMYSLAHHYNYRITRGYRDYIRQEWGPEVLAEAHEAVWGNALVNDTYNFTTETMNIKGQDLEAFMKHWQVDLNSQPGDYFDVIIEMPSKDRGVVTFNRCPVVEEYEAKGQTDELRSVCMSTCPPAIKSMAKLYNEDIDLNVLAMPPRKSKDHICCKFEVFNKSCAEKSSPEVNLEIDKSKKDVRGELKIDPNVELQDYSGPFKPDLRITDFSREQLARMYLMAAQYDLNIMIQIQTWVTGKYGFDATGKLTEVVWGEWLADDARELHMRFMNIAGNDIESMLKAIQVDITAQPPNFNLSFELPSPNSGFLTFHKCFGVDMLEPLGMNDELLKLCAMDPPAIGGSAMIYHPDMRTKILAFPPRESDDHVCCKWEFYYNPTAPKLTWFDGRE